jgi:hypothetical protein
MYRCMYVFEEHMRHAYVRVCHCACVTYQEGEDLKIYLVWDFKNVHVHKRDLVSPTDLARLLRSCFFRISNNEN